MLAMIRLSDLFSTRNVVYIQKPVSSNDRNQNRFQLFRAFMTLSSALAPMLLSSSLGKTKRIRPDIKILKHNNKSKGKSKSKHSRERCY